MAAPTPALNGTGSDDQSDGHGRHPSLSRRSSLNFGAPSPNAGNVQRLLEERRREQRLDANRGSGAYTTSSHAARSTEPEGESGGVETLRPSPSRRPSLVNFEAATMNAANVQRLLDERKQEQERLEANRGPGAYRSDDVDNGRRRSSLGVSPSRRPSLVNFTAAALNAEKLARLLEERRRQDKELEAARGPGMIHASVSAPLLRRHRGGELGNESRHTKSSPEEEEESVSAPPRRRNSTQVESGNAESPAHALAPKPPERRRASLGPESLPPIPLRHSVTGRRRTMQDLELQSAITAAMDGKGVNATSLVHRQPQASLATGIAALQPWTKSGNVIWDALGGVDWDELENDVELSADGGGVVVRGTPGFLFRFLSPSLSSTATSSSTSSSSSSSKTGDSHAAF